VIAECVVCPSCPSMMMVSSYQNMQPCSSRIPIVSFLAVGMLWLSLWSCLSCSFPVHAFLVPRSPIPNPTMTNKLKSISISIGGPQHQHQHPHHKSYSSGTAPTSTSTHLNALLRPDWLRRASRIKQIQQEKNKAIIESLKDRQKALGVGKLYRCYNPSTLHYDNNHDHDHDHNNDDDDDVKEEGGIRSASSASSLSSASSTPSSSVLRWKEQMLIVYLVIPETEYESRDETNIIHHLKNGDIVKSTAPRKGIWIEHDRGGWSASSIDGMERLRPISDS